jgi:hypothetical protein
MKTQTRIQMSRQGTQQAEACATIRQEQEMKHASSHQVFEYWNERRGHRIAPERADIQPGPIRRALGDTFILAQDSQGAYCFRLAGTRSCALFCRELKGAEFVALWAEPERADMLELITAVSEESAGFIAGASGHNADGAVVDLELLLLPLGHRPRSQARLLGVLAPLVPPYWLGTTPVEGMTCGTIRYLGPGSGHVAAPRLVPGTENGRVRRGLTIYNGGRS